MEKTELVLKLNAMLLNEMPQYQAFAADFSGDAVSQRRLLRSLMNLRPPLPLDGSFVNLQDELLKAEREEKGVVYVSDITMSFGENILLWKGDITRLAADAIVNAANSALLGCFHPCHGCIDNSIHSAAGLQLRMECDSLMKQQGHREPVGQAKRTKAYNLPCRYVLHTVGPMVLGEVSRTDRELLASCYRSCLTLSEEMGLQSVAFCCISTGEFRFPPEEAAHIAVRTVREYLKKGKQEFKVIFNVFKESDFDLYKNLLAKGAG
jgi:O-acetyl-ADP-ribose deacetylase (regulator of RNase III)